MRKITALHTPTRLDLIIYISSEPNTNALVISPRFPNLGWQKMQITTEEFYRIFLEDPGHYAISYEADSMEALIESVPCNIAPHLVKLI